MFLLPGGIFLSSLPPLPTLPSFPFFPLSLPSPPLRPEPLVTRDCRLNWSRQTLPWWALHREAFRPQGMAAQSLYVSLGPTTILCTSPLLHCFIFLHLLFGQILALENWFSFVCLPCPYSVIQPRADLLDRLAHACASGHVSGDLHMNSQRSKGMCAHIFIPARGFPALHICLR